MNEEPLEDMNEYPFSNTSELLNSDVFYNIPDEEIEDA